MEMMRVNRDQRVRTNMWAMCSEISAQKCGTRELRVVRAYCLRTTSESSRRQRTPAAEDWIMAVASEGKLTRLATYASLSILLTKSSQRLSHQTFLQTMLVRRQLARVARTPIARRTLATEATGKQATEKYFSDLNHLEHHAHSKWTRASLV
jgi:hypothetical protein